MLQSIENWARAMELKHNTRQQKQLKKAENNIEKQKEKKKKKKQNLMPCVRARFTTERG